MFTNITNITEGVKENPFMTLEKMLKRMNVPAHRKSSLNKNNLQWLLKNLEVRNSNNPLFNETIREINDRLENRCYES